MHPIVLDDELDDLDPDVLDEADSAWNIGDIPAYQKRDTIYVLDQVNTVLSGVLTSDKNFLIHDTSFDFLPTFVREFGKRCQHDYVILTQHGDMAFMFDGCRIHDFFRFPENVQLARTNLKRPRLKETLEHIDVFLIPAVEDLSPDTLYAMDWCLRYTLESNTPFAGKRIILVGNVYTSHRPYPNAEIEWLYKYYQGTRFYYSPSFDAADFSLLNVSYLQGFRDPIDEDVLLCIATAQSDETILARLLARASYAKTPSIVVRGSALASKAANHNALTKMHKKRFHFHAATTLQPLEDFSTPCPRTLELSIGARVVFLTNHPQGLWHRGSTGTIKELDADFVRVHVDGGFLVEVEPVVWYRYTWQYDTIHHSLSRKEQARIRQLPLSLGYAVDLDSLRYTMIYSALFDLQTERPTLHGQLYQALNSISSLGHVAAASAFSMADLPTDQKAAAIYDRLS
jgi:hypothetical protein